MCRVDGDVDFLYNTTKNQQSLQHNEGVFLKAQKIDPVTNIDLLLLKKEVHHSHRAIDGKGA
jgi:hypothetical protein